MKLQGTPEDLHRKMLGRCPCAGTALQESARIRGQLLPYQAAALFVLVEPYNGKSLLEIGTLVGYSASLMAQACPTSSIITLNHAGHEVKEAIINLKNYRNVQVLCKVSWDYYNEYKGPDFGAIFVDGDHVRVARDLVWWNKLVLGGLMLFHDYTPNNAAIVVQVVDDMANRLGREPDVKIIDTNGIGMAGFYKRIGDK